MLSVFWVNVVAPLERMDNVELSNKLLAYSLFLKNSMHAILKQASLMLINRAPWLIIALNCL